MKHVFEGVTGADRETAIIALALKLKGIEPLPLMCHCQCHPRRRHADSIATRLRQMSSTAGKPAAAIWLERKTAHRSSNISSSSSSRTVAQQQKQPEETQVVFLNC